MMNFIEQQTNLVAALKRLTQSGEAQWVRSEPEFAYCLVGGHLIKFELSQGQEDFNPSDPVHGIIGKLNNIEFLWLEGVGGWNDLLALIQAAPVNDGEYTAILLQARTTVLQNIETLAKDRKK